MVHEPVHGVKPRASPSLLERDDANLHQPSIDGAEMYVSKALTISLNDKGLPITAPQVVMKRFG